MGEQDWFFLTDTPWSHYLQVWRSGSASSKPQPFWGLLIHFVSKRFGAIKHQISWPVVIIMWPRIIPSVRALTLSHHQAGYKLADTHTRGHTRADAASRPFVKDQCLTPAAGACALCQGEPLCLELERIIPCRLLNLKMFRGETNKESEEN